MSYKPEFDYKDRDFEPFRTAPTNDMCGHCKAYYKDLYDKGETKSPFPPQCSEHILNQISLLQPTDFNSEDEFEAAKIIADPVAWAQMEFGWEPRWYQEFVMNCTSRMKVLRGGRRSGKSRVEIILMLHEMMTMRDRRILLLAPSEKLIGEFFEVVEEYIRKSSNIQNSIERSTKNPHLLKLKNGSKLLGFSISPNDPSAGDKVRGFDAHTFVLDEADFIKDSDIEAILALLVSNEETRVMVSSTPKGWRKKFYDIVTRKDIGFKEFWWISAEKPDWTDKMEQSLRMSFSDVAFTHEFYADFGETEEGVFKKNFLDQSLHNYDITNTEPVPNGKYILGVDWNKSAGNHMVILQPHEGRLMMVKKIVIPESEYMQTQSVDDIIDLHRKWNFKYIFVDYGYGATQVELIKKRGTQDPSLRIDKVLKPLHMNQSVHVIDPTNGLPTKRPTKHYLVMQTAKLLEDGNLILPKSEDYGTSNEKGNVGLIQQMRNFRVEAYSIYYMPRYSQGEDHTLTAFMLACGGWVMEEGELKQAGFSSHIMNIATPSSTPVDPTLTEKERIEDAKKYKLTSGKPLSLPKSPFSRDFDTAKNRGIPTNGPHTQRSNFNSKSGPKRRSF